MEEVNGKRANCFDLRPVEQPCEEMTITTVTIIIIDKKASLAIEKLDDLKENALKSMYIKGRVFRAQFPPSGNRW